MKNNVVKVMSVENDPDFAFLVHQKLIEEPGIRYMGCAANKDRAVEMAVAIEPHIVLMDLHLSHSRMDGIEIGREIRLRTNARILILTVFEDEGIITQACKLSFASAYLLKSQFEMMGELIRSTAAGNSPYEFIIQEWILSILSPAERAVFDRMLGKEVALSSSPKTIANQQTMVLKKLNLQNKQQLVKIFGQHG